MSLSHLLCFVNMWERCRKSFHCKRRIHEAAVIAVSKSPKNSAANLEGASRSEVAPVIHTKPRTTAMSEMAFVWSPPRPLQMARNTSRTSTFQCFEQRCLDWQAGHTFLEVRENNYFISRRIVLSKRSLRRAVHSNTLLLGNPWQGYTFTDPFCSGMSTPPTLNPWIIILHVRLLLR